MMIAERAAVLKYTIFLHRKIKSAVSFLRLAPDRRPINSHLFRPMHKAM